MPRQRAVPLPSISPGHPLTMLRPELGTSPWGKECDDGEDGTLHHLLTWCSGRAVLRRDILRNDPTIREALAVFLRRLGRL